MSPEIEEEIRVALALSEREWDDFNLLLGRGA
jgi:hypothetical protein